MARFTRTMSRTIITHGSTQMAVLSMLFFGGEALHYFALALTIGILFGIYSSVLVASPLLMLLGVSRKAFIGALLGGVPPLERAAGTAGACVAALLAGVRIFRVHDVRVVREALVVADAIRAAGGAG